MDAAFQEAQSVFGPQVPPRVPHVGGGAAPPGTIEISSFTSSQGGSEEEFAPAQEQEFKTGGADERHAADRCVFWRGCIERVDVGIGIR